MFNDLPMPKKTLVNRLGRVLRERDIEQYGKKVCEKRGWLFEKFVSPEKRAVPDRLVTASFWTSSLVFFIEFKKPHEKATRLQQKDHEKRRARSCLVFVVDSFEEMDEVMYIVESLMVRELHYVPECSIPERLIT